MSPPYPHRKREAPRLANTIIVAVLPSDLLKSNPDNSRMHTTTRLRQIGDTSQQFGFERRH